MALFPLEIDSPRPRPRHPPPTASSLLLGAGFATSIVYLWGPFFVMAAHSALPPASSIAGLAAIVLPLVFLLQAFLLCRLLSQTRACPVLTDPVDAFFFESRAGSAMLLCLCVPWCVMGAYALLLSLPAAFGALRNGHESGAGRPLEILSAFIMVTTPLALGTGIWWASTTGLRALYRVLRADGGRWGQYEGVPLGLDEPRPDEQDFQRSMRAGSRSRGKATTLFGVLPRPSWPRW